MTLVDSLEWVETMLHVDERLDLCMQMGPALADWFTELHLALAAAHDSAKPSRKGERTSRWN
jgi:hypothetical protein